MYGLVFLLLPSTPYGHLVETPKVVMIGEPKAGTWWARGTVERRGTVLLLWTSPDGRKAYGQYWRGPDGSFDGWWGWMDETEFDADGCLGGEVMRETIGVRR